MEGFPLWGTLVNTGTVIFGSLFGLLIHVISKRGKIKSPKFTEVSNSIMRGLGLAVVMVGIGGALKGVINDTVTDAHTSTELLVDGLSGDNTIITILAIVLGVLIGGLIDIDRWVNLLGKKVGDLVCVKLNDNYSYYVEIRAIKKGHDDENIPISSY